MINTYRDLVVWQKSMVFVTSVYKSTGVFPGTEQFGLTSQIRRSAISIPSNIAEGYGRRSTGDYIRFLQIAIGSLYEAQTQIEITFNLNYLPKEEYDLLHLQSREIERMLSSLVQKIKSNPH
ncbi:four helix bundle protein [Persicitalea sp.]|uniref:four helix bundle protein n=1 Tax=Persicitalea sp. TaxID=3100273 RepID=UPI0035943200